MVAFYAYKTLLYSNENTNYTNISEQKKNMEKNA